MTAFHVRVIEGGKIAIPAALRRKYGFEVGQTLVVSDGASGLTISSLDEAVARAQAIMAKVASPERILSNELVVERRQDATRE
jgi:bifunctional DNA-binding transcriptional regulator/antitoxin component of YhaV-PrlF toxin-antitoxin module